MLKLYDYFRSSAAFRVRLALNCKNLDYEKIKINLLEDEQLKLQYLQINPAGLVPTLQDEDSNLISQSLAIIEYLDEVYPDKPLLPKGALARAYVRSIALTIAADIHPLNNRRVLGYLKTDLKHEQADVDLWYQHWIKLGLCSLEQIIKNSKLYTGAYCYTSQITLADICLLPQLFNARRFNCDVSEYPTLLAIEAKCQQFDYIINAYPEK